MNAALGRYEHVAAERLYSGAKLAAQAIFEFAILRYASSELDPRKFIFHPIRIRSGELNEYALGVGVFLVIAKVDPDLPFVRCDTAWQQCASKLAVAYARL